MPFEYKINPSDWYIRVEPVGEIAIEDLKIMGAKIKESCREAGLICALVDCGSILGALDVSQLFYASQEFTEAVGPGISVAYINPPPQWNIQDDQFSRNVINNRGGLLELFPSVEMAEEWLAHTSGRN